MTTKLQILKKLIEINETQTAEEAETNEEADTAEETDIGV